MFSVVCIALLAANAMAWPQPPAQPAKNAFEPAEGQTLISIFNTLPKDLQEKAPHFIKRDLEGLTTKDLLVLKNIVHELPKFTSLGQIRQVVKQYSPHVEALAERKAVQIAALVAVKRSQLLPETRNVFHQAGDLSKNYAKSLVQLVQQQPQNVKTNLEQTFPHASYILNSPLLLKLEGLLNH
ncbi:hypothetical protein M3Y97_00612200 [Aphelenchoides bicaudatus]|nr:hypothetical protein M3Y97_00612200 [Aphelenchoides bicaudatus]